MHPEKRDAAGDQNGHGVEAGDFFRPELDILLDAALYGGFQVLFKIFLAPIVRLTGEMLFDQRENDGDSGELDEELENDARKEIAEMDWLTRERDGREDGADDEECETEIEGKDSNVKRK